MDPAAQQQHDADRAALKANAEACLFQMVQATRCFNTFCNDMQAAVNELSQYDVARYLDVGLTSDYLKDRMLTARNQSAVFFNHWQDHPSVIRYHIHQMSLLLSELRTHRNRIAHLYLTRMDFDNPKPWEMEKNLDMHLGLLKADVDRIFIFTGRQCQLTKADFEAGGLISKDSSPAPQEG